MAEMSMVEKVAKAICATVPGTGDVDGHFSGEFPLTRKYWMEMALAAIEAMREPTEEMKQEAWRVGVVSDGPIVYEAMIDAALNGKEG